MASGSSAKNTPFDTQVGGLKLAGDVPPGANGHATDVATGNAAPVAAVEKPEMTPEIRAALQRAMTNIALVPWTPVALLTNNANFIEAAQAQQEALGSSLFDLGDALGWFSGESPLPAWVIPTLALTGAINNTVLLAMMQEPKPIFKKKGQTTEAKPAEKGADSGGK